MINVYFYFVHDSRNVRGFWHATTPPGVGDEVELWPPSESDSTCIVTRRRWFNSGESVDVFVDVVDRNSTEG